MTLIGVLLVILSLLWMFRRKRGRGISIIIPFRAPTHADERIRNLDWLKLYWKAQLPGAEIVIGDDPDLDLPFSKSVAINRAVAKSKGDVLVLVDADGYLTAESVLHCAAEIRESRKRGHKLWFIPYRKFYRLTDEATLRLLNSNPKDPHVFPDDMSDLYIKGTDPNIAHWHGALIQILPREAFYVVGGWDERFRGWGGEDQAAMRATDVLYALHKTLPVKVLHLWHPMLSKDGKAELIGWKERIWEGQDSPVANSKLCSRYYQAYRKGAKVMRELVDEWIRLKLEGKLPFRPHHHKHKHKHHHHCPSV